MGLDYPKETARFKSAVSLFADKLPCFRNRKLKVEL